jgi:phosphatidate cytidylyltransferase
VFKYRAISFPILIALLAVMILWPEWGRYLFVVVASLAAAMMFREIGAMLRNIGVAVFEKSTVLFGGLFLFSMLSLSVARQTGSRAMTILFFLLLMFCMLAVIYAGWLLLLFGKEKKENFDRMLRSVGIFLLAGTPVYALSMVYFGGSEGPVALFYVMMVTKSMDTGGYIFGMLSGKYLPGGNHKIVPSISPKKSWEGTIGGVLLSVAVSLLFYWYYAESSNGVSASLAWYILAGVILAVGSFAGDLTESALKRTCGVKDSGHWIPGMGGAFDVLDSFIYNGVIFWILCLFRF